MHAKTLIFDSKVVLDGSVNMTHNGFENNKEHMYRVTEPTAVAEVVADFNSIWAQAEEVTQSVIDKLIANKANKDENKTQPKRSGSRTVSRSLSTELDDASATGANKKP